MDLLAQQSFVFLSRGHLGREILVSAPVKNVVDVLSIQKDLDCCWIDQEDHVLINC